MTQALPAVLDPGESIGTAGFTVASRAMELGAVAPRYTPHGGTYLAPGLDPTTYYVDAGSASADVTLVKTYSGNAWAAAPALVDAQWASLRQTALESIASDLEARTAYLSVMRRAATMPSFNILAEAGTSAIRLALQRLRGGCAPLWLFFLERVLPDEIQAEQFDSVDAAAQWWRRWGRVRGLI